MEKYIFVTFNPNVPIEESTALRLQTISNLYGVHVDLPDRKGPAPEFTTRERIKRAGWIVALCVEKVTKVLLDELSICTSLNKHIIIVYDSRRSNLIDFQKYDKVHVVEVNPESDNIDVVLNNITKFISQSKTEVKPKKKDLVTNTAGESDGSDVLLAILGIGLGLLLLWAITKES